MTDSPRKPPLQFSLAGLFGLTAISAILIAVAVAGFGVKKADLHDLIWHASKTVKNAREWLAR